MDTTVTIIGGGQAGLAMSRTLSDRGIDHVVLERGSAAHSWRTERWDSLRLLTPNWMTRLPGHQYDGVDPNGYMTAAQVAGFLERYSALSGVPLVENTTVSQVEACAAGYRTITDQGVWISRCVVIATGACSTPKIPGVASLLPDRVHQLAPIHYRNPGDVADGHTLVVGASASGVQLAEELRLAGRRVTLAVGSHVRLPRTYRGMDIHWWMDAVGRLDERVDELVDPQRASRAPSLQLVGSDDRRDIGLAELAAAGVQLTGRLVGVTDSQAQFSGAFANACRSADLKQDRLLELIDTWVAGRGLDAEFDPPTRPAATTVPTAPLTLPLDDVDTVVWATGFRPNYPWLPATALAPDGTLAHDGGVLPLPGMYAIGLPFMRRRKSAFLDGVGQDAFDVAERLAGHLDSIAAGPTALSTGRSREGAVGTVAT